MSNPILRRITLLGATLAAGALLVACDDDDTVCTTAADCADEQLCVIEEGQTEGICVDPEAPAGCSTSEECADGFSCEIAEGEDAGICIEDEEAEGCSAHSECEGAGEFCIDEVCRVPYTWIAIASDTSNEADLTGSTNPGPDVDAVEVIRGGQSVWAQTIEGSQIGERDGENNCQNPESVLDSPDSMPANGQSGECTLSGEGADANLYFCLGGIDGYVTVSFGDDFYFEDGDQIRVWELGHDQAAGSEFTCTNTTTERFDAYSVYAGIAGANADPIGNDNFLNLGASGEHGGVFRFTFDDPGFDDEEADE